MVKSLREVSILISYFWKSYLLHFVDTNTFFSLFLRLKLLSHYATARENVLDKNEDKLHVESYLSDMDSIEDLRAWVVCRKIKYLEIFVWIWVLSLMLASEQSFTDYK